MEFAYEKCQNQRHTTSINITVEKMCWTSIGAQCNNSKKLTDTFTNKQEVIKLKNKQKKPPSLFKNLKKKSLSLNDVLLFTVTAITTRDVCIIFRRRRKLTKILLLYYSLTFQKIMLLLR